MTSKIHLESFNEIAGENKVTQIKSSAGDVFGWNIKKMATGSRNVKLYDVYGSPTVSDTPIIEIPVGESTKSFEGGIRFENGIFISHSGDPGDEIISSIFYK
jgi:hypothetical protein